MRQLEKAIEKNLGDLQRERDSLISPLGFITVGRQNLNSEKIVGSFSGNVIRSLVMGSGRLVALTLDRIWDKQGIYLSNLIQQASTNAIALPIFKESKMQQSLGFDNLVALTTNKLADLHDRAEEYQNGSLRRRIRIFRSEQLAHSQLGDSRDRLNLGHDLFDFSVTLDDLTQASRDTLEIIDSFIAITVGLHINSQQFLNVEIGYVNRFWRALPDFSAVE